MKASGRLKFGDYAPRLWLSFLPRHPFSARVPFLGCGGGPIMGSQPKLGHLKSLV